MDLELLRKLMEILESSDLAELEIEEEGTRIRLKKQGSPEPMMISASPVGAGIPASAGTSSEAANADIELSLEERIEQDSGLAAVRAPMVGTFYRSPAPDAEPFVKVGDRVEPDTVVCIVEAMKIMNDIKAEVSGAIVEILVSNTEPVQYNQPLFLVRVDGGT